MLCGLIQEYPETKEDEEEEIVEETAAEEEEVKPFEEKEKIVEEETETKQENELSLFPAQDPNDLLVPFLLLYPLFLF